MIASKCNNLLLGSDRVYMERQMAERKKAVKKIESVEEWIAQWPQSPGALIAVALARAAETLPRTLEVTFRPWPGMPSPAASQWLKLYRKHRRIRAIGECFGMGPLSAIGPLEPLSASQKAVLRGDGGEDDRVVVVGEPNGVLCGLQLQLLP